MSLSLKEGQVIAEMGNLLYSFLPGKPHPYANRAVSFEGIAREFGHYWPGGSKQPVITSLLNTVLDRDRSRFCDLIVEVVRRGMDYRGAKRDPITRAEIQSLNELLARLQFKIPELHDRGFLDSLPSSDLESAGESSGAPGTVVLKGLHRDLLDLVKLDTQRRGYAFERLLNKIFTAYSLAPRGPFRVIGEQIDGSFELDGDTYLVEARWRNEPAGASDLYVLHEKVAGKATWSRGLFISNSGFSLQGTEAYGRGRSTNLVGMSGEDLHHILDGMMPLPEAIRRKARRAAETGRFYVSVYELAP